MRYHFYNPHENKVFVARYVEFFENSLTLQKASGSLTLQEASRSDVGLELLQEEDTQTFCKDTSSDAKDYELEDHGEPVNYMRCIIRS
ncbi:hypothetical protein Tco_0897292 [Tanacetum coccineum]